MSRHPPSEGVQVADQWKYKSMKSGPVEVREEDKEWVTSIYRGLVPAKNILERDFAIAGSLVRLLRATYSNPSIWELI